MQIDNFCAWISVDGCPLQENDVQYTNDQLTATCWVASEDGKPFVISWQDTVRAQASMGRTIVDGIKRGVPKGINRRGYKRDEKLENDTAHQRGVADGSTGRDRAFVFGKVDWTDEEQCLARAKESERLGEIRLEISYIKKRGQGTHSRIDCSLQAEAAGKVHELTKRMIPHRTKFGSLVKVERKPVQFVKSMGKKRVFVFKYRPLETLRAMGIITNSDRKELDYKQVKIKPEHIDVKFKAEDYDIKLKREEKDFFLVETETQNNGNVKPEENHIMKQRDYRVKPELLESRCKVQNMEIIDLTDDSDLL